MVSVLAPEVRDDALTRSPASNNRPVWFGQSTFIDKGNTSFQNQPLTGFASQNLPIVIPQNPQAQTGSQVSPKYSDIFYNRIVIEPASLVLGAISSEQQRSLLVFNAFFDSRVLEEIQTINLAGITITGDPTPTIFSQLQEKTFAVTITQDGPPNIDGSINFNFQTGTTTNPVTVTGSRLVLFPYRMRPGLNEEIQFLTQVLVANNGTEQRIRNRQGPRHFFNFTADIPEGELNRAENLLYGWRRRVWGLPIWGESRTVTSAVPSNSQVINVNTDFADFRVGELAVIWDNPRTFDLFEISSFTQTQINIDRELISAFSENAIVAPARTAFMPSNPNRITNGFSTSINGRLQVMDNIEIANSASAIQFNGTDVLLKEPLYVGRGANESFDDRVDVIDFNTGVVTIHSPWLNAKVERSLRYVLEGQQEIWEFRQFLHRRGGSQRPFYMPTFENNIRITSTGNLTDQIQIANDEYGRQSSARNNIAFLMLDGTWIFRTVTGVVTDSDTQETITLNTALNENASDIRIVSYLGLKRLLNDNITFTWQANNVVNVQLPIKEISP